MPLNFTHGTVHPGGCQKRITVYATPVKQGKRKRDEDLTPPRAPSKMRTIVFGPPGRPMPFRLAINEIALRARAGLSDKETYRINANSEPQKPFDDAFSVFDKYARDIEIILDESHRRAVSSAELWRALDERQRAEFDAVRRADEERYIAEMKRYADACENEWCVPCDHNDIGDFFSDDDECAEMLSTLRTKRCAFVDDEAERE